MASSDEFAASERGRDWIAIAGDATVFVLTFASISGYIDPALCSGTNLEERKRQQSERKTNREREGDRQTNREINKGRDSENERERARETQ